MKILQKPPEKLHFPIFIPRCSIDLLDVILIADMLS